MNHESDFLLHKPIALLLASKENDVSIHYGEIQKTDTGYAFINTKFDIPLDKEQLFPGSEKLPQKSGKTFRHSGIVNMQYG